MKTPSKIKSILIIAIIISVGGYMVGTVEANASAAIIWPRFGSPMRGPFTPGQGLNTSDYLDESVVFWVGPEPAESPIPASWLDKGNWDVALVPSVMPSTNCTPLVIESVQVGKNKMALFGGGLDVNPVIPSALGIKCKIPANIAPVLYNLAIGFKNKITPEYQLNGSINLTPKVGAWKGSRGTASQNPFVGNKPFLLIERNAVSIPWQYDARSSDGFKTTGDGKLVSPFTIMHVTDTHYYQYNPEWLLSNQEWENDTQAIAPDAILLTGDVMENPGREDGDGAFEYEMAYQRLAALNLPIIMMSGNHDNKNLGPWSHYFGPLFSSSTFDDVRIVAIDSTLPFSTGTLNWIDQHSNPVVKGGPVLLSCHYNPDPSYFSSGWLGIGRMMIEKNITAILTGHTHGDLVGSMPRLHDEVFSNMIDLVDASSSELRDMIRSVVETTNETTGYLEPISEPLLINTRSAAKESDVLVGSLNFTSDTLNYSGYRLLSVKENLVSNYTYDYNGDGQRDPQISYPVGMFSSQIILDAGIGVLVNANATCYINNTSNEDFRAVRAVFEVPLAPSGYHWNLDSSNLTAGAYIRTTISNATHQWIDVRAPSPRTSLIQLKLVPQI